MIASSVLPLAPTVVVCVTTMLQCRPATKTSASETYKGPAFGFCFPFRTFSDIMYPPKVSGNAITRFPVFLQPPFSKHRDKDSFTLHRFSHRMILINSIQLAIAASLVTARSTMSTYPVLPDTSSNRLGIGEIVAIVVVGGIIICIILLYLIRCHLRKSKRSICDFFKPSSQYFIFRRCCGKKRKYAGPLEQDYQPYEMIRPQGHHHAGTGVKEGFENVPVSEV